MIYLYISELHLNKNGFDYEIYFISNQNHHYFFRSYSVCASAEWIS